MLKRLNWWLNTNAKIEIGIATISGMILIKHYVEFVILKHSFENKI